MTEGGGDTSPSLARIQKGFLLFLVVAITVLFLVMIRRFLVALILAGVFAGMTHTLYLNLAESLNGRTRIAALATVLGLLVVIVVPVGAFLAVVLAQAVEVVEAAGPWIGEQAGRWQAWIGWLDDLPVLGQLLPEEGAIAGGMADLAGQAGTFLVNTLGAATTGTVNVALQLFVMAYAMYFFLTDGPAILSRILYFTPLDAESESKLVGRFVSVTRATIKGSILVGLIQGGLAGAAFFVLGIPGAALWSMVMTVLSVIPLLGAVIVWGPAAVILISSGDVAQGIGLALWGLLVVSTIDNFVRPRLIGRDIRMHDLLVLLSTFGGLAMFGLVGFMVGPIIAALFLTAWDLIAVTFADYLPEEKEVVVGLREGD